MTMQNLPFVRHSDLVKFEGNWGEKLQRKVITLNLSSNEVVTLGQVVYRAKGTDPTAVYAKVSASGQIAATNEFAVVFGDKFSYNPSFTADPTTPAVTPVIAYTNGFGGLVLKNTLPDALLTTAGLTAPQIASLKLLMENQGIFFSTDL